VYVNQGQLRPNQSAAYANGRDLVAIVRVRGITYVELYGRAGLIESTWLRAQAGRHGLDVIHHLGGTIPPTSVRPLGPHRLRAATVRARAVERAMVTTTAPALAEPGIDRAVVLRSDERPEPAKPRSPDNYASSLPT
jgi:hypothetical protein